MRSNLVLWIVFLASGIVVSEMIQSKETGLEVLGETLSILFLVSSLTHYLAFRRLEDLSRDRKKFMWRGSLLFGNAITLFTVGLSMFYKGIGFGLVIVVVAVFLGYEGWRTKSGYKFFIPVRKR
jgi:hypothetical protein